MTSHETSGSVTPVSRAAVSVGVGPSLRPAISEVALGRHLVIDANRSRSCCAWIGDLWVCLREFDPGRGYTELAPVEGVRLFARSTLLGLLAASGPTLVRRGLPFRRGVAIELARPELWIDWLERPGVPTTADV